MSININGHGQNSDTTEGMIVKSLLLSMRLVNTAGTGTVAVMPNLNNINIQATLRRGGIDTDVINGTAFENIILSLYKRGLENVLTAAGAGLIQKGPGNAIMAIEIKLPGVIVLAPGDKITTAIQVSSGTYGTGLNINACEIDTSWQLGHGHEEAIPVIKVHYIDAQKGNQTFFLGNGITRALVVNTDKGLGTVATTSAAAYAALPTDADQVITALTYTSSGGTYDDIPDRMWSRANSEFESPIQFVFRGQCFLYGNTSGLDNDGKMSIKFNKTNVNAGANFIVVEQFVFDAQTTMNFHAHATQTHDEHTAHVVNEIGGSAVEAINTHHKARAKRGLPAVSPPATATAASPLHATVG